MKTRKKSKYKHTMINKKIYYFYKITWLDICGDSGWATKSEFDKFMPSKMVSQAYVYSKDKKLLRTFLVMMLMTNCLAIEMFTLWAALLN